MNENRYILSVYKKQKWSYWKLLAVVLSMLLMASIVVTLNMVRLSPMVVFFLAMLVPLFYASKREDKSKYYESLEFFLKQNVPDLLSNQEIIFFIDYHLTHSFNQEELVLLEKLHKGDITTDQNAKEHLLNVIAEIKNYYDLFLLGDGEEETNLSLREYRATKSA